MSEQHKALTLLFLFIRSNVYNLLKWSTLCSISETWFGRLCSQQRGNKIHMIWYTGPREQNLACAEFPTEGRKTCRSCCCISCVGGTIFAQTLLLIPNLTVCLLLYVGAHVQGTQHEMTQNSSRQFIPKVSETQKSFSDF